MPQREHTRRWWVAGGLVVLLGFWWMSSRSSVTPDVVEGWVSPNETGSAVAIVESNDDRPGTSYLVAGARWVGTDNVWHDGSQLPTCVGTDTGSRTHVQLGVVHVEAERGSWPHVVWLRCLN